MEELSTESMDAAIDHAIEGDLEYFKNAPLDILLNARDSNDANVLSIVVGSNHVECCKEICKRCPSLLCSQHYNVGYGYTPLHFAAEKGYLDILKILISTCNEGDLENQHDIEDQGGDRGDRQKTLRSTTTYGYNAMHSAVDGGQPESIKLLIEADPNKELLKAGDNSNYTPLDRAVEKNNLEIARLLIEADPDFLYGVNSDGHIPLFIAIDKQQKRRDYGGGTYGEMLKLVLELQPIQSTVKYNEKGWTALHYCVSRGYSLSIECIIQSCPESSKVVDNEGQNFFHHSVNKLGNEKMVEEILRMKEITEEVLNSTDNSGRTPFEVAVESQNEGMIYCLYMDHRVNKILTVIKNLNCVVEKHNIVILELFMREIDDFLMNIEEEVFLESKNEEDETILFKAAEEGKPILCQELCKRCPSLIYHQRRGGHTALHHAVLTGSLIVLPVLIKAGGAGFLSETARNHLLTIVDDQGDTALHKAVQINQLQGVEDLVEADPDYNYRPNKSGYTPYMLSIEEARSKENNFNSGEIRKLLFKLQPRQAMAWRWENGWTLLHDAASKGNLSCIEDIINFCPRILDVDDNYGKNFLHIAAELGKVEVVRLVLRTKDISSNVLYNQDKYGNTPMHIAAKTGNLSLMECFLSDLRFSKIMPHGKENGWKLPHHAASDGDLGIIKDMEDLSKIRQIMDAAIDHARKGDLEFLKDAPLVILLNARDSDGGTVLSIVVDANHVDCCEEIRNRCPSLLTLTDKKGQNFFHHAVKSGNEKMVRHILSMTEITMEVLNSTDNSGRTPFDVAAESQNQSMIFCLNFDRRVKIKLTLTKNLNWAVEKRYARLMESLLIYRDDFLEKIDKEVFWKSENEEDETILFKVVEEKCYRLCAKLCKRCPDLICHTSKGRQTALHHAASRGSVEVLEVLIKACFSIDWNSRDRGNPLFVRDDQGDTALHKAVLNHQLRAVELLVEAEPNYEYGENKSGNTPIMLSIKEARSKENKFDSGEIKRLLFKMQPSQTMAHRGEKGWTSLLHQATSEEDLSIIEDIINCCTGYLDVDDDNGKNFLHIAVELGKIEVVRLVLSAKYIINLTSCLERLDKEGKNFLHIAAELGNVEVVRLVLRAKDIINLTSCLEQLDKEGKNFLHIAAEFEKVEIVKQVLRVKDIPKEGVLDKKDNDGNTPFHIAALTGNELLTRRFLFDRRVDKDTKNKDKQHVLSEIKFPYDKRKAGVVGISHTVDQSELKDQSDFDLVVGALIATVSFAAGITVPGGYISDGPNQGTPVFSKRVSFASFTISNTFALVFSLFAVFTHFCARRLSWDEDIICLLNVAKVCTLAAMYCMMAAFIAGSFAILAKPNWLAIVVCIISCLFFIFGCGPLLMWMIGMRSNRPASEHFLIWFKKCFGLEKSKEGALAPRDVATHHQNTSSAG